MNGLIRCLAAAIVTLQGTCALSAQAVDPSLQGVWFGNGPHPMENALLVVDDDRFIVVTPMGAFVSQIVTKECSTESWDMPYVCQSI